MNALLILKQHPEVEKCLVNKQKEFDEIIAQIEKIQGGIVGIQDSCNETILKYLEKHGIAVSSKKLTIKDGVLFEVIEGERDE